MKEITITPQSKGRSPVTDRAKMQQDRFKFATADHLHSEYHDIA